MFKHNYQKEVWLPINDVAWSSCEVSNLGNVRKGRKIKSLTLRKDGYLVTGIRQNNKATTQLVHILVAKTFIENKTGFKYVNHIDGVKSNNKASNLTWCSQSENIRHSISLGTFSNGKYPSSNYAKNLYRPVRSFQNELWDNLPDFEDKYQVSNLGRVKLKKGITKSGSCRRERLLDVSTDFAGYQKVTIINNHKSRQVFIHRLVAQAFIENPSLLKEVNHKDGIKSNNRVSNLEWTTRSNNIQHAYDTGLKHANYFKKNKPPWCKTIIQKNLVGESIREFDSVVDAAKYLNVKPDSIYNCAKKKSKTAHSYQWEYKK